MISIVGPTSKQIMELQPDRLLIIQGATWEDYWTLSHEDLKVEFIQEMLYIHSPATLTHEEIFAELLTEIRKYLQINPVGKVWGSRFPIILADGKRAEPDLFYLSNEEIENGLSDTIFKGSPSWIIEIVSPSYRDHDTQLKKEEYRKIGTKEYWIFDYELQNIEIIKYENNQICLDSVVTQGLISPDLNGFRNFSLDIDSFWKKIRVAVGLD
jgi:Uma2 family endonuclease